MLVFKDGRTFAGRWIDNLPSDGVLTSREGRRLAIDYRWNRGKYKGGSRYELTISFDGGDLFVGEVDEWFNPTKGLFRGTNGDEVASSKYSDFFAVTDFFQNSVN